MRSDLEKTPLNQAAVFDGGTRGRSRTCDFLLRRQALYPLSYAGNLQYAKQRIATAIACVNFEASSVSMKKAPGESTPDAFSTQCFTEG